MPGIIDDMMDRVDRAFEKHGVEAGTPELDNLLVGRPRRNYRNRTHEELLIDVNQLYDKLIAMVRERDDLRDKFNRAQRKLDALNLKFWIVSSAVLAEAGVIGFLANELFSRLK